MEKTAKLYFFAMILLLCQGSLYPASIKYRALKGDPAFEWKTESNIPYAAYGLGKVIKTAISKNKLYFAALDKGGIELYNLKKQKFIKKLMLENPASEIFFPDDKSIIYRNYKGKYIKWEFFGFSFKKVKAPSSEEAQTACDVKTFVSKIEVKCGSKKYVIQRDRKYFYRFLSYRGKYYASSNASGIIYAFKPASYTAIKDRLYDINGKICGATKDGKFVLTKNNGVFKIYLLKGAGRLIKEIKAEEVVFSPVRTGIMYIKKDNILQLALFSGRVLKTVRLKGKIKSMGISKNALTAVSDKLHVFDLNLKVLKQIKGNFKKALFLNNKVFALEKTSGLNNYSLVSYGENKRVLIKKLKRPKLYFNNILCIKEKHGIYFISQTKDKIYHIKGIDNLFALDKKIIVIKKGMLYLKDGTNLLHLHINAGTFPLISGASLFFTSESSLHSMRLDTNTLSFLKKLSHLDFYNKAKSFKKNKFAEKKEIDNMLYHFYYIKDAVLKTASYYQSKENYKRAFILYKKLLSMEKLHPEGLKGAGICILKLGKHKKSIYYLSRAALKKPNDYLIHYYLGTSYSVLKNNSLGIKHLEASIKLYSGYKKAYQNLGLLYTRIRRYDLAEKIYLKGLKIDSTRHELHFNLGKIYEKIGRYVLAIKHYKEAKKLKSKDSVYAYEIGYTYIKLKKWDMALKYLKETIRLNPNYAPAQYNIAYIYHVVKKNYLLAKYHFKRFLKLKPNYRGRARILKIINSN